LGYHALCDVTPVLDQNSEIGGRLRQNNDDNLRQMAGLLVYPVPSIHEPLFYLLQQQQEVAIINVLTLLN
jgi:hypothetical protein